MGFLDALTADAYPRDSQGRRVFAPFGQKGRAYILPPERAARLAYFQRRLFQVYVVALLVAGLAFEPWALATVGLLSIAGIFMGLAYSTRGLEESSERPTLTREERVSRGLRAMGRPTMVALCLGGLTSAAVGASLLLRGERSVAVWFITLYGLLVAVLYGRQLARPPVMPPAT
jgi:hypothetical protein